MSSRPTLAVRTFHTFHCLFQIGSPDDEESVFPRLPGSHLQLTNPALEFVKALFKVLSLDSAITNEMNKLRRNLLKLIGVGEFSDDADWRDPCISFVLPEVICKQCNHCRDIDLCKDPHQGNLHPSGDPVWVCASANCKTPYDTQEIEHQLLDAVQRKTMGYCLQDLQCSKCRGVKELNMPKFCSCAGAFRPMASQVELGQLLKTFKGIAKHYRMPLLQEVTGWTMKMNGME